MLRNQLKKSKADSLIHREEYPQVLPKEEYPLSELCYSLMLVMDVLCLCGNEYIPDGVNLKKRL